MKKIYIFLIFAGMIVAGCSGEKQFAGGSEPNTSGGVNVFFKSNFWTTGEDIDKACHGMARVTDAQTNFQHAKNKELEIKLKHQENMTRILQQKNCPPINESHHEALKQGEAKGLKRKNK